MRHGIALLTVRAFIKTSDWDDADQYLDGIENCLDPESVGAFRGFLAHSRGESKKAETFALEAQRALSRTSGFEVKIFLGRLFVMIGRLADALPLFQEAFDSNVPSFDAGNLLDCAARMRKDGVVINTFRALRKRGVNDWGTVSFGVQYLQKYVSQEAVDVLDGFLKDNPDHKMAKLCRSVIGLLSDRAELVNGTLADIPSVEELPVDHILQVIHVLRYANHPDEAVNYAYSFLRLHYSEPDAHRALLITMTPFEPVPTIEPKLDRVEVGAAVSYRELPSGNQQWRVIEKTTHPCSEFEEIPADSTLASELLGKQVGEKFLLAAGMVPRHGEILQIVPKYVRRYGDTGDQWQIRFPGEPMIESVHLGSTAEEAQGTIEVMLKAWEEAAQAEVQMRNQYSSIATPLHVFGACNRKNAFHAIIHLAQTDEQFVRVSYGTTDEQTKAIATLQSASCLVLDLSSLATLQMLGLGNILTTKRFTFLITEDTWKEMRQTLGDKTGTSSPSISVGFRDGQRVRREVSVEEKQRALRQNKEFLDLLQKHCQIIPVIELAFVEPEKRDPFEKIFGQYGAEAMLLASKPGMALWTDDLVQSEMAALEFGSRRVWTQAVLSFLASLGLLEAKERDAATAKLISMGYNVTMFDCASIIEAVHLCDAKPWRSPLKDFIQEFGAPNADLRSLFPILCELIIRLYREPLLPESRCRVVTAFMDVLWKNATSRTSILSFRANSPRLFGLNSVGQSQFESCFDNWIKAIENPLIPGT
jgi:transcription elongation GreA/GreB family factor